MSSFNVNGQPQKSSNWAQGLPGASPNAGTWKTENSAGGIGVGGNIIGALSIHQRASHDGKAAKSIVARHARESAMAKLGSLRNLADKAGGAEAGPAKPQVAKALEKMRLSPLAGGAESIRSGGGAKLDLPTATARASKFAAGSFEMDRDVCFNDKNEARIELLELFAGAGETHKELESTDREGAAAFHKDMTVITVKISTTISTAAIEAKVGNAEKAKAGMAAFEPSRIFLNRVCGGLSRMDAGGIRKEAGAFIKKQMDAFAGFAQKTASTTTEELGKRPDSADKTQKTMKSLPDALQAINAFCEFLAKVLEPITADGDIMLQLGTSLHHLIFGAKEAVAKETPRALETENRTSADRLATKEFTDAVVKRIINPAVAESDGHGEASRTLCRLLSRTFGALADSMDAKEPVAAAADKLRGMARTDAELTLANEESVRKIFDSYSGFLTACLNAAKAIPAPEKKPE